MLQPVVRRTWAPRGCTPVLASWDRHDRLSVISALMLAPRRRRLSLRFSIQGRNVRWPDVYRFIRAVMVSCRRPVVLVLDRLNAHRSAVNRRAARFGQRVQVEWLPAYAPELNPVEHVWSHTKHSDLANYIPKHVGALAHAVRRSLRSKTREPDLLRSFFKAAGLKL
jgi:transposase